MSDPKFPEDYRTYEFTCATCLHSEFISYLNMPEVLEKPDRHVCGNPSCKEAYWFSHAKGKLFHEETQEEMPDLAMKPVQF